MAGVVADIAKLSVGREACYTRELATDWRTLLTIAAVVVVPITLLHYLLGDLVRTQGESTRNGVVETAR